MFERLKFEFYRGTLTQYNLINVMYKLEQKIPGKMLLEIIPRYFSDNSETFPRHFRDIFEIIPR